MDMLHQFSNHFILASSSICFYFEMKQYAGGETKFIDTGVNLVGLFLKLGYGVGLISICAGLALKRGRL